MNKKKKLGSFIVNATNCAIMLTKHFEKLERIKIERKMNYFIWNSVLHFVTKEIWNLEFLYLNKIVVRRGRDKNGGSEGK